MAPSSWCITNRRVKCQPTRHSGPSRLGCRRQGHDPKLGAWQARQRAPGEGSLPEVPFCPFGCHGSAVALAVACPCRHPAPERRYRSQLSTQTVRSSPHLCWVSSRIADHRSWRCTAAVPLRDGRVSFAETRCLFKGMR